MLLNCGARDVVVASVYLDINLPVDPPWLEGLLNYAGDRSSGILLAVDSNAQSTVYGPDQNSRGTDMASVLRMWETSLPSRPLPASPTSM